MFTQYMISLEEYNTLKEIYYADIKKPSDKLIKDLNNKTGAC